MVAYAKNPVKLIDEPLRMSTASNDYYYAHDHLYNVSALIGSAGDAVEYYEYDAYGNCHVLDTDFSADADGISDFGNPYLFTGRRLDILDSGSLKIQYSRHRYYHPEMGRFMQQDPLGITPNAYIENQFDIHKQYDDGTSLYLAMNGNPMVVADPHGLTACCKINRTHTNTIYWNPGGYGPPQKMELSHTKCTQETVDGYEDCDAKAACCAAYKDDKNVSVYEAEEGKCKWCDVQEKLLIHTAVYVRCDTFHYTAEISLLQGSESSGCIIYNEDDRYDWAPKLTSCRVSERVARLYRMLLKNLSMPYFSSGGCWGFNLGLTSKICSECP